MGHKTQISINAGNAIPSTDKHNAPNNEMNNANRGTDIAKRTVKKKQTINLFIKLNWTPNTYMLLKQLQSGQRIPMLFYHLNVLINNFPKLFQQVHNIVNHTRWMLQPWKFLALLSWFWIKNRIFKYPEKKKFQYGFTYISSDGKFNVILSSDWAPYFK